VTGATDRTTEPAAASRWRWSAILRIAVEFAFLFCIALLAKLAVAAASPGAYPNPLWLPVIVLSLQHGLAAGLAAAVIAAGLQYWAGLPAPLMTEDMYGYIGRIAAEPVGWTCVALLIGHIRSRQIAQSAELEAELAERSRHSAAVAGLCVDLRARTEMLERHIAASAQASNIDVAEAVAELQHADWDEFAPRLTRFVALIAGAAEFSVYLMRDGALKLSFQPGDEHRPAADVAVAFDDPLFAAIVQERRTLSAAREAEGALIGNRGALAGPLLDAGAPERVIGMLTIGGHSIDDLPDDIERRFALVAAEVSRQAPRISLLDTWRAAAAPSRSNGHGHDQAPPEPTDPPAEPAPEPHALPGPESRADGDDAAIPPARRTLPDNEFTLR
jgi:polysaccharide biosynthesis protein PelD